MGLWGKTGEQQQTRPERIEAEMRLSCKDEDVLKRNSFRIFAYIQGQKNHVGYALVTVKKDGPKPEFNLPNLTVEPRYQGHGIGSQIMDYFEALVLRHDGVGSLGDTIKKNSKAAGMYERRGWRKDGKRLIFP